MGLIYNSASSAGLLSGSAQASLIDGAYAGQFLPSLTTQQVASALKAGNVTIVDARLARDFDSGHLPGAVNIPPGSPQAPRRAVLASASAGTPIIIYCQSLTCPFSERLAADLLADGFTNLSLYRGGWEEWSLAH
jgi:rhodanese-related sulfurtransferase